MGLARLADGAAIGQFGKPAHCSKGNGSPLFAGAAEAEQCKAVVEKYNKGLLCGFLEPESTIPAFLRELEDAGIDAIIQEKQRQLDAWLAQNGK